jgi:hypothetical protein
MPTVPDISLGVTGAGAPPPSPLGTLGQFAQIQNSMNQNRLFQQQFAAKQRLGQIMAAAPDPESGFAAAMRDPVAGPFAGEAINQYRQGMLSQQQLQNEQQAGAKSGFDVLMGALPAGMSDPSQLMPAIQARLKLLSPNARSRDEPAIMATAQSLTEGLDKLPPDQATKAFNSRLTAIGVGSGVITPDTLKTIYGTPTTASSGDATHFGLQLPPQLGGGFAESGQPLSQGVAPSVAPSAGGGTQNIPGIRGGQGANALVPGGTPSPPPSPGPSVSPPPLAGDGQPLLAPDSAIPKPQLGTNNLPVRDPAHQKSVEDQLKRFNDDQSSYDMSAQVASRLDAVKDNIQTLAKGGGWMSPGAGGELRANLGNAINTANAVFRPGEAPPIDTNKIAAAQDTMKETANLGFGLLHQMFGGGREALGMYQGARAAVPGLDNSPLGGMMVADLLKSGTQWMQDQRAFKQDWLGRSGGDLTNADTTFASQHTPTSYVKQVMDQYGMTPNGFKDVGAIKAAKDDGLINGKIAYDTSLKQGFITQRVYDAAKANNFGDK